MSIEISLLLAKFWGILMVIFGLIYLLRPAAAALRWWLLLMLVGGVLLLYIAY